MPARSNLRDFQNRRIALDDLAEANDRRVTLLRVASTEKLPPVVVFIVRDVQNRLTAEDD